MVLEVVLGIDNVIFVSIIMNRLQTVKDQKKARRIWMITGIIIPKFVIDGIGLVAIDKKENRYLLYLAKDLILPAL